MAATLRLPAFLLRAIEARGTLPSTLQRER